MNRPFLVIWTVGTHASGKSAWAAALPARFPGLTFAVIEDEGLPPEALAKVRPQPPASVWGVMGCHLDPADLQERAEVLATSGVEEQTLQYFPASPLVVLIREDGQRPRPVGAAVLRDQLREMRPEAAYWACEEDGAASWLAVIKSG